MIWFLQNTDTETFCSSFTAAGTEWPHTGGIGLHRVMPCIAIRKHEQNSNLWISNLPLTLDAILSSLFCSLTTISTQMDQKSRVNTNTKNLRSLECGSDFCLDALSDLSEHIKSWGFWSIMRFSIDRLLVELWCQNYGSGLFTWRRLVTSMAHCHKHWFCCASHTSIAGTRPVESTAEYNSLKEWWNVCSLNLAEPLPTYFSSPTFDYRLPSTFQNAWNGAINQFQIDIIIASQFSGMQVVAVKCSSD